MHLANSSGGFMLGHVPESQWGTLKTIQQDHLSRDDMTELLCHLQAIALSQSHLIEILIRLASETLA